MDLPVVDTEVAQVVVTVEDTAAVSPFIAINGKVQGNGTYDSQTDHTSPGLTTPDTTLEDLLDVCPLLMTLYGWKLTFKTTIDDMMIDEMRGPGTMTDEMRGLGTTTEGTSDLGTMIDLLDSMTDESKLQSRCVSTTDFQLTLSGPDEMRGRDMMRGQGTKYLSQPRTDISNGGPAA